MGRVELARSAWKELDALSPSMKDRILAALGALELDPRRSRPGADIRRLAGREELWRLRVGDYRVVYAIEGDTVVVTHVLHRSVAYR